MEWNVEINIVYDRAVVLRALTTVMNVTTIGFFFLTSHVQDQKCGSK